MRLGPSNTQAMSLHRFLIADDGRGRVVHVLHPQYLALRFVADPKRHEIVASCRDRRLVSTKATATPTAAGAPTAERAETGTARNLEELRDFLESAGECALDVLRSLAESSRESTTTSTAATTSSVPLTGPGIP
jgi:hypothetical protein